MSNGLIGALDAGSSKVCCFIARIDDEGFRVVGIGHQVSRGLRAGAVVDMAAADRSILAAVHAAEEMAGERLRNVYLNFSAGNPASRRVEVEVALNGQEIGDGDIHRLLGQGRARCAPDGREVIHTIPLGFAIDGNRGIRQPRGMYGERFGVNIHVVSAEPGPMRNLTACVTRCHLDVAARVVSPYASGLACLVEDEIELGATVLDMGGGTTGVAVFLDGQVVHTDVVPVGGNHITNDIARGLSTSIEHAARMKVLFGSAIPSPSDEREMIDVRHVGEPEDADPNPVPRSQLVSIIRPRIEETFELVRERLEASGFGYAAGRRLVVTGGACQLQGVREFAGQMLGKHVRLSRPLAIAGLAEATAGPAFSTCAGLLMYAVKQDRDVPAKALSALEGVGGRIGRIGRWLRDNV